jgi:hypothetical protein
MVPRKLSLKMVLLSVNPKIFYLRLCNICEESGKSDANSVSYISNDLDFVKEISH